MKTQTLEEKIQEETRKITMQHHLGGIADQLTTQLKGSVDGFGYKSKVMLYESGLKGDDFTVSIDTDNLNDFLLIRSHFEPTDQSQIIGTAGKDVAHTLENPFRLDLENGVNERKLLITWYADMNTTRHNKEGLKGRVHVCLSIKLGRGGINTEFFKEWIYPHRRNISDSERHYFVGRSEKQLRELEISCYQWYTNSMTWYGGNQTNLSDEATELIISKLNKLNYKSQEELTVK